MVGRYVSSVSQWVVLGAAIAGTQSSTQFVVNVSHFVLYAYTALLGFVTFLLAVDMILDAGKMKISEPLNVWFTILSRTVFFGFILSLAGLGYYPEAGLWLTWIITMLLFRSISNDRKAREIQHTLEG
jgi:hypothetical protein